jgi:hypothetical protein
MLRLDSSRLIAGLDDRERSFLATYQKIYRWDTGCDTPFEEFFGGLVWDSHADAQPEELSVTLSKRLFEPSRSQAPERGLRGPRTPDPTAWMAKETESRLILDQSTHDRRGVRRNRREARLFLAGCDYVHQHHEV